MKIQVYGLQFPDGSLAGKKKYSDYGDNVPYQAHRHGDKSINGIHTGTKKEMDDFLKDGNPYELQVVCLDIQVYPAGTNPTE